MTEAQPRQPRPQRTVGLDPDKLTVSGGKLVQEFDKNAAVQQVAQMSTRIQKMTNRQSNLGNQIDALTTKRDALQALIDSL